MLAVSWIILWSVKFLGAFVNVYRLLLSWSIEQRSVDVEYFPNCFVGWIGLRSDMYLLSLWRLRRVEHCNTMVSDLCSIP